MRASTIAVPLLFFLVGALGTGFLYQMIKTSEQQQIHQETEITAEQVQLRLEAWIDSRTALATHLSSAQFADAADIEQNFRRQALTFVDLYPGILALNFIDRQWVIRQVVPAAANAPALNKDLHNHPSPGVVTALGKAEKTRQVTRTTVIDLLQGGKGFATYHPLVDRNGQWLGYVNGVFRIGQLIDSCLDEKALREHFSFRIVDSNGDVAYLHAGDSTGTDSPFGTSRPVRIADQDWILHLTPNADYVTQSKTAADEIMAVAALVLLAGLALLLRMFMARQHALRQSQAKYRLLVENQIDLVVKLDAECNYLYVSPSYCDTFGLSEKDLLGTSFLPTVHPEDRDSTLAALDELKKPPHRSYVEQRSLTSNGIAWQAWTNVAVLDADGALEAITAVGRDVTRRRELEDQLSFSRKMQAVGQLAGGIAHDFNNLLQAMLGNLQFVVQDTRPVGQTATDLQEIEKGIGKAMTLTRQLLTFSRRQELRPKSEDLNHVVAHTLEQVRRTLPTSITLVYSPADQPIPVRVDRGQVEQMVQNLFDNSRDAITTTGKINVTTSIRAIDEDFCLRHPELEPGNFASLVVSDNGHGMRPEVLERVFEPFYTTREVGAGTGLGLATIFGIVQQHHGTIIASSTEEMGSDFTILLPLELAITGDEPATSTATPQKGNRETILLAEDDRSVRELSVRVLERANYNTLVAEDGKQAVAIFEENQGNIDLVMLDMVMPNMNGREAREAIVAMQPDVPILFASGYDPATLSEEGLPADTEDILMKPYGIPDLLHKVREILDRD